jgi:predicted TPR repeat methyltransferase
MLEQARVKGIYAELREADLMAELLGSVSHWPLILAADVLCYFGALEEVMAAVHARLEPGGWFAFSLEQLVPDHDGVVPGNGNWALLRQGRYAHAADYARASAVAAGFTIRVMASEVVRWEAGVPVEGILIVLERTRHDG